MKPSCAHSLGPRVPWLRQVLRLLNHVHRLGPAGLRLGHLKPWRTDKAMLGSNFHVAWETKH